MTYKDGIFEAERICYRMQTAINALEAVHIAMTEGPNEAKEYEDGLFFICMALGEEAMKLEKVVVDAIHGRKS